MNKILESNKNIQPWRFSIELNPTLTLPLLLLLKDRQVSLQTWQFLGGLRPSFPKRTTMCSTSSNMCKHYASNLLVIFITVLLWNRVLVILISVIILVIVMSLPSCKKTVGESKWVAFKEQIQEHDLKK